MRLNANILSTLIAVYRGTLENELYVGTRHNDLKILGQAGLVVRATKPRSDTTYQMTERGNTVMNDILTYGSGIINSRMNGDGFDQIPSSSESRMVLHVDVDASSLERALQNDSPLSRLANMSAGFTPEASEGKGITLGDVEEDKARLNGGTFFIVAEAGVKLNRKAETLADFESIELLKIDALVHPDEEAATRTAVERSKAEVGSRHIVLKAVAMHEVAVPIKSTRL